VPGGEGVGDAHVLSQAIVDLGRALSLDMIAEGIETQDQADWFRTLGCRLGQGYHYARPMPVGELERYLRRFAGGPSRSSATDGSPITLTGKRLAGTGITDVLGARKAAG
jgi:predicted signal transduction protein with EAL and GGDEF domain